jgi:hypothetical protein
MAIFKNSIQHSAVSFSKTKKQSHRSPSVSSVVKPLNLGGRYE